MTAGAVDYETSQEAAERFSDISAEQFRRAVVCIDTDGKVFFGAEAVYKSLGAGPGPKWLSWSYERIPGFAEISELSYRFIARHRILASVVTKALWGRNVQPPGYGIAQAWFLRALGAIYMVAFISLWTQLDGLIGEKGILPVRDFLLSAQAQAGNRALALLPTLCWLGASNTALHCFSAAGVLCSALLIVGIVPIASLVLLFVLYLSLTVAGQTFLSFQWDVLLLETGFIAIFFAPTRPWLWRRGAGTLPAVPRAALFLLKLLLFKLMLMSGVVKLTSGDDCWANLTALDYHYWSQPLPTVVAWFADQQPEWVKRFSVAFCLFVEIVVPFFIWAPRRLRLSAAGLLIFLQIGIAVTGNYCFFNLLTIALSLLLLDDASLRRSRRADNQLDGQASANPPSPEHRAGLAQTFGTFRAVAVSIVVLVMLPLNACLIFNAFKPDAEWPRVLAALYEYVEPFRIVNGYGLFRVMTKDRREIVVEGSRDGIEWRAYAFRWKPGDVRRAPGWCAPHQPRLDWQMWFAALSGAEQNPWFLRFVVCLLEDKPDVERLLATNPFPDGGPRYVRAVIYRYRFTTTAERKATRAWWKRQELGEYLPPVSLRR